jgi:putative aminopeptidase FrvX
MGLFVSINADMLIIVRLNNWKFNLKYSVHLSKENNIDYVIDTYRHYGSDASALLRGGAQIRHALIGPGVDASHSYERTHVEGLLNTAKLVIEYCK